MAEDIVIRISQARGEGTPEYPRLSVLINDFTVTALRDLRRRFGWSATECVRQAFTVLKFAVDATGEGKRIAVISPGGKKIHELVFEWQVK